jgi:hypothetical protein
MRERAQRTIHRPLGTSLGRTGPSSRTTAPSGWRRSKATPEIARWLNPPGLVDPTPEATPLGEGVWEQSGY